MPAIVFPPGLVLIRHTGSGVNLPVNPALPYMLELNLRLPQFLLMFQIGVCGGNAEIVVVQSKTCWALRLFIGWNRLRHIPVYVI